VSVRGNVRGRADLASAASELRIVLGQLVRRLRAEHRFPISHGAVLGRLDREGPSTTSGLAAAERMRPQSMAQVVGDLLEEGLVARRPDPSDGRRILVEITVRGVEALHQDRDRRAGWLAQAIEHEFDREEREQLLRAIPLLRRLADREG
jgi:DNA-binding MarR family transcriptional regulator